MQTSIKQLYKVQKYVCDHVLICFFNSFNYFYLVYTSEKPCSRFWDY